MRRGGHVHVDEHHVQDALEVYAVARMQKLAQDRGMAITADADEKLAAFIDYAAARGYTPGFFDTGPWAVYKRSYDHHLPAFVGRLADTAFPGERLDFLSVETEYRAAGLKGDFVIVRSFGGPLISVSMKNYRGDIRRPQFNAQTYNSFALGLLFEGQVGVYADPITGGRFKGSSVVPRDAALVANGYAALVPFMHQLDELNRQIKAEFVYDPRFEFLDETNEAIYKAECKRVGDAGADILVEILALLDPGQIKARLLKMTGLDGAEETLLMDSKRCSDTLTNPTFRALRDTVQAGHVEFERRGQSIVFMFADGARRVLPVNVPFTINKNGAWISDPTPPEGAFHVKEGKVLLFGQRRPKKSKELATSINTYVDFAATGIFD